MNELPVGFPLARREPLLQERFEATLSALRRNDPATTVIDNHVPRRHPSLGRSLGEALQGNIYVSFIHLNLDGLLQGNEEVTNSISPLTRYISESKSLRKLAVVQDGFLTTHTAATRTEIMRCILLAISESHHIEELWLISSKSDSFAESFVSLVGKSRSLKILSVSFSRRDNEYGFDVPTMHQPLKEAFAANQSLESLALRNISTTEYPEQIIRHLGPQTRLRELILQGGVRIVASARYLQTLGSFLQSTSRLEHLMLRCYYIKTDGMEHLVTGLHSNRSLTKLSLLGITLREEETDMFRTFMQTSETMSSIRELSYEFNHRYLGQNNGNKLASCLTLPVGNPALRSSIVSSLLILDLQSHCAQFCDALAANAHRIRLQCLRLHFVNRNNNDVWEALDTCLPKLVYLNKLELIFVRERPLDGTDHRNFIAALQTNGSLQHVIITNQADVFNENEMAIIRYVCTKNLFVAKAATDVGILPLQFQLAKQATRTAPNAIVNRLLDAGDSIGPSTGSKKRSASTTP